MNRFGSNILSVVAGAMVISIVGTLFDGKSGTGKLIRMVCALVLGVQILSGLTRVDISNLQGFADDFLVSAVAAAATGNFMASEATFDIIKAETESYILDKANELGAALTVEVFLSEDDIPIPVSVRIQGTASPYARNRLTQMIQQDLGIEKEKQEWIGWK